MPEHDACDAKFACSLTPAQLQYGQYARSRMKLKSFLAATVPATVPTTIPVAATVPAGIRSAIAVSIADT